MNNDPFYEVPIVACAERDALVRAIDEEMQNAGIGVFGVGDDPKLALHRLAVFNQSVGARFPRVQDRDDE